VPVPLYQAKAELLRTLGHPARIRILELLSERDHAVHELLERIAIEPSNLMARGHIDFVVTGDEARADRQALSRHLVLQAGP
jgi:hypothetical protein